MQVNFVISHGVASGSDSNIARSEQSSHTPGGSHQRL